MTCRYFFLRLISTDNRGIDPSCLSSRTRGDEEDLKAGLTQASAIPCLLRRSTPKLYTNENNVAKRRMGLLFLNTALCASNDTIHYAQYKPQLNKLEQPIH